MFLIFYVKAAFFNVFMFGVNIFYIYASDCL